MAISHQNHILDIYEHNYLPNRTAFKPIDDIDYTQLPSRFKLDDKKRLTFT